VRQSRCAGQSAGAATASAAMYLCGAARVHGARVVVCLYTRRCGRYFLSLLFTPVTPSQFRVQLQQRFRILTMYTFDPYIDCFVSWDAIACCCTRARTSRFSSRENMFCQVWVQVGCDNGWAVSEHCVVCLVQVGSAWGIRGHWQCLIMVLTQCTPRCGAARVLLLYACFEGPEHS
jgi:hypothetical protein